MASRWYEIASWWNKQTSYLHLKSHDPAARSTLFGCQSRLRTVERIGFLICLLTHLEHARTHKQESWNFMVIYCKKYFLTECVKLTSRFQTQSSKRIWAELHCPPQTCSPAETTSQMWQHGWSWGWQEWASTRRPSGSTRKRCDPLRRLQSDRF